MKLIVGLGNPGEKYQSNRHNVGFMFVDALVQKSKIQNRKLSEKFKSEVIEAELNNNTLVLLKPQTFMNESGKAVSLYMNYSKLVIENLVLVHDDLDLKLGEFKINVGKGPKVHNGVNSVEEALGTKEFLRVRIGVDNRNPENRIPGEAYVLQNFTNEEQTILTKVFESIFSQLKTQY